MPFWHWPPRIGAAPTSYSICFPTWLVLSLDASCTLEGPGHLHSWSTGSKFEGSHGSLEFHSLLEQHTELRKTLYLWFKFYYKRCKSGGPPNEETYRARSGKEHRASVPSPCCVRVCDYRSTFMGSPAPLRFSVQSLYQGFNTQVRLVKSLAIWLNSVSSISLLEMGWLKFPTFSSQGQYSWWPSPVLKLWRGPRVPSLA